MGDVADMMLDGTLCEGCGVFLEGCGDGYPRRCAGCLDDVERAQPSTAKVSCSICGRRVKQTGLHDHMRDKHPADTEVTK